MTGGSLTDIQLDSLSGPEFLHCFNETATCSLLYASGDQGRIDAFSGNVDTGGGSPFTETCPTGWTGGGAALAFPGATSGTWYEDPGCKIANVTSNATATAAF